MLAAACGADRSGYDRNMPKSRSPSTHRTSANAERSRSHSSHSWTVPTCLHVPSWSVRTLSFRRTGSTPA